MLRRTDPTLPLHPSRGTILRARIFALLQFSLVFWACIYFALIAVTGHTWFRSLAFGFALLFALWLVLGSLFSDNEPIPIPDTWLWAPIAAWVGWSAASYFWSVHPAYTKAEIGTEIGWGVATATIFYVAARSAVAFRALVTMAALTGAFLALVAIHGILAGGGIDPEKLLQPQHGGVGAFSTFIALLLPLLPLLLAPRPIGYGTGPLPMAGFIALFALLLVAARVTENRMIWLALAAGFVTAAALAAWRWRGRLARAPLRWTATVAALLLLVGVLFVDATVQRAKTDHRADTTLAQAIKDDPRFALWRHSFERIAQRPWAGFGFGKSILRTELQGELGDPMLAHAHNLFVSQWLQTGAIGVLALCAMFLAFAWRYAAFMRSPDGTLAAIGIVGLVMLATFIVKNLTDDFLIRPTSKEFWALNALLVGYGLRLQRARMASPAVATATRGAIRARSFSR
ncbi:MAG: O-antigen ligase family protein [Burkholderiales bacterium]|nr:O-antigen ligase family protein [Burkholderiales bacterium]